MAKRIVTEEVRAMMCWEVTAEDEAEAIKKVNVGDADSEEVLDILESLSDQHVERN